MHRMSVGSYASVVQHMKFASASVGEPGRRPTQVASQPPTTCQDWESRSGLRSATDAAIGGTSTRCAYSPLGVPCRHYRPTSGRTGTVWRAAKPMHDQARMAPCTVDPTALADIDNSCVAAYGFLALDTGQRFHHHVESFPSQSSCHCALCRPRSPRSHVQPIDLSATPGG